MADHTYWQRQLSRRRLLQGAAAGGMGLLGLALVGCGDEEAEGGSGSAPTPAGDALAGLVEAAKREGVVNWYSAMTPTANERVVKAFQDKYGITVRHERLVTSTLGARFAAEAESGNVATDVVTSSDVLFLDHSMERGWLIQADAGQDPAYAGWPEEYRRNGWARSIQINQFGYAYNTTKVRESELPKDWKDFTSSRWKGEIIFGDPRGSTSLLAWTYLVWQKNNDDFLRQLGRQDLELVSTTVTGIQKLAAGEKTFVIPTTPTVVSPLESQGAPVKLAWVSPTTGAEMHAAIVAKSPHPNAGRLLFNFLLTKEGQKVVNEGEGASVLSGIEGAYELREGYQSPQDQEAGAAKDRILALLGIS